jgi:hypothetical protein
MVGVGGTNILSIRFAVVEEAAVVVMVVVVVVVEG